MQFSKVNRHILLKISVIQIIVPNFADPLILRYSNKQGHNSNKAHTEKCNYSPWQAKYVRWTKLPVTMILLYKMHMPEKMRFFRNCFSIMEAKLPRTLIVVTLASFGSNNFKNDLREQFALTVLSTSPVRVCSTKYFLFRSLGAKLHLLCM